jgi:hypothetical protein
MRERRSFKPKTNVGRELIPTDICPGFERPTYLMLMEMINAENCGKVLMMKWLGLKYSGN